MNKYRLLEKIGEGSFGVVMRALNPRGDVVAVKEILNCNPFDRDRLQEEVNIMNGFSHPNLVKVEESFYDQEHCAMYIVMEFCDTDLLKFYKRKHADLTQVDILFIFREIVGAFTVMNDKGVIHRDLKPENILVNKEGHIKIADFGCAKKLDSESLQRIIMSFDKGTATYASPEILRALAYSSKCDVWSAGCVLYVLVTGKHPFLESNISKTIKVIEEKTRNKQITIPFQDKIDGALRYAIKRCLMYSESDRCSWREFSLCRLFVPKVHRVKSYLDYLKNMSNIANWICQTFWKERKQYNIADCKDQIFTYFIIKYESSVLELGQSIIDKDNMYSYLFEPEAWQKNELDKAYKQQFHKYLLKTRQYLASVKNAINSPQALFAINETRSDRIQCFADLQHSILAAQKILNALTTNPNTKIISVLTKWVNFERWFDFSMRPTLEKVLVDKQDSVLTTFTSVASLNSNHH